MFAAGKNEANPAAANRGSLLFLLLLLT